MGLVARGVGVERGHDDADDDDSRHDDPGDDSYREESMIVYPPLLEWPSSSTAGREWPGRARPCRRRARTRPSRFHAPARPGHAAYGCCRNGP
jgi:hypothetical protein